MNIKDIAKLAGVGIGTVSRVINNHPDVKDETREKIKKIIKDSNYIPNNSARNLKMVNSNTIGVLVRGVFNPFFSEMIDIIGKRIHESGYTMLLKYTDYSAHEEEEVRGLIEFQKEIKLQGIIYLGCDIKSVDENTFKDINVPLVLTSTNCTYNLDNYNFSYIGIRQVEAAFDATKYLLDKGHKNIAIILGLKEDSGLGSERLLGYKMAIKKAGMKVDSKNIIYGKYSTRGAYEATKELISKNKDLDAIFSISDIMAIGAAKALLEKDIKVGKDISLIGFDGMEVSEFYNPSITTIVQPRKEMAEKSTEVLLDLIKNKGENKHIVLDTKLVERESVIK